MPKDAPPPAKENLREIPEKSPREKRLQEALRQNLSRRKTQPKADK